MSSDKKIFITGPVLPFDEADWPASATTTTATTTITRTTAASVSASTRSSPGTSAVPNQSVRPPTKRPTVMTAEGLKEFKRRRELGESFVPPQSSGFHAVSIPTVSGEESQSAGSSYDSAVKILVFQFANSADCLAAGQAHPVATEPVLTTSGSGLPTIRLGAPL